MDGGAVWMLVDIIETIFNQIRTIANGAKTWSPPLVKIVG